MEETEKLKLYFKSGSNNADTEDERQVKEMAYKVAVKINKPVKGLIKKFEEILNEKSDNEKLEKLIELQTLLPLSSILIRTFTAVPTSKYGYTIFMEKMWEAIEKNRINKEKEKEYS